MLKEVGEYRIHNLFIPPHHLTTVMSNINFKVSSQTYNEVNFDKKK